MGTVYLITNTTNGKRYVGQTSRGVECRWSEHLKCAFYESSSALHRAIRKYGNDSFKISVLEECRDEFLDEREMYWIDELGTFAREYNMTLGGDGVRGRVSSDDERLQNSLTHSYKVYDDESCERKRTAMLESLKVHRKAVEKLDEFDNVIGSYCSVCSAAKSCGSPDYATLITRCCRSRAQKALGFHWRYANECDRTFECKHRPAATVKCVAQCDLFGNVVAEHDSIASAARSIGKNSVSIRMCCHDMRLSAYGFLWKFM